MFGGAAGERFRVPLAKGLPRTASYFDTSIRTSCPRLGEIDRAGAERVRTPFNAANDGCADLPKDRQPARCSALARHTKMASTVRYLGFELEDALAIAEAVER